MQFTISKLFIAFLISFVYSMPVYAEPVFKILPSKSINRSLSSLPIKKIMQLIYNNFQLEPYRQVDIQIIENSYMNAPYALIYLHDKKYHRLDFARIDYDENFNATKITQNYHLSQNDFMQQPGIQSDEANCPDPSIEFIVFAPNDINLEQTLSKDVAAYAEAHSLKTVTLLKEQATRSNYLNYMSCPNLKGNFYNGDGEPYLINTYDGVLSSTDFDQLRFNFKVTNIWLACQSFNKPMKTSLLKTAESQKYAAGITELAIGPSDRAAHCAMKAAIDGQPMRFSFLSCYVKYDTPEDVWGFDGKGSDYFGI